MQNPNIITIYHHAFSIISQLTENGIQSGSTNSAPARYSITGSANIAMLISSTAETFLHFAEINRIIHPHRISETVRKTHSTAIYVAIGISKKRSNSGMHRIEKSIPSVLYNDKIPIM